MADDRNYFRYLNREGRWLDFSWSGLDLCPDGALRLSTLPMFSGTSPAGLGDLPAPNTPAGLAVDLDGSIYFAAGNKILRTTCDGQVSPVPCLGAYLDQLQLSVPCGLLIPSRRRVLLVVDSGHHEVLIYDLESWQLLEVWGGPGTDAGRFNTPWAAASDVLGNVYILDYGNQRVQKFGLCGDVEPAFWQTMQASGTLTNPVGLAAYSSQTETWLYVLDKAANKVFIFDAEGNPRRDAHGNVLSIALDGVTQPMGLVATANALYLGSNGQEPGQGTVVKFEAKDLAFYQVGAAVGYRGPVAALALDEKGNLLVHTGSELKPVVLVPNQAFRSRGMLWSKAIAIPPDKVRWYRLSAERVILPVGSHLQFFVRTSDVSDDPQVVLDSDDPFPAPDWQRQESDVTDFFLGGAAALHLWVGVMFSGNGLSSAVLPQVRVDFNRVGYAEFLPAIYREKSLCADFLTRFLALVESFFAEGEHEISQLPKFFDPAVIPKQCLPWLAGWLALQLEEDWTEALQRQAIAQAFANYARRGTREGLRDSLLLYAGVSAIIQEPILNAAWWALPGRDETCRCQTSGEPVWTGTQDSALGFTTMLAPAHPQGAVLGSSAVLDQSHLIGGDEFGLPLFSDVAHQFTVQVYPGQVRCPAKLAEVEAILEREKPAQTAYHLCFVKPQLRVGFQARLGMDTVVAEAAPSPTGLGDKSASRLVLAGQPRGRIGQQSSVGGSTRL